MIEVSLEKEKLLDQFFKLTKSQTKSIREEEFDSLDKLLVEKAELMERIDELDSKFLEEFNILKEEEDIESMEEIDTSKFSNIKELKEVATILSQLLKDIYEVDSENTKLISKNLEGVKSELKHVKDSKAAYKGYNVEQTGSIMIDERK